MSDSLDAVIRYLVAGLRAIASLSDAKRCRDPMDDLVGELGEDAEGFRLIHPRMKRGMDIAAKMARETLDSMPNSQAEARSSLKPDVRQEVDDG